MKYFRVSMMKKGQRSVEIVEAENKNEAKERIKAQYK